MLIRTVRIEPEILFKVYSRHGVLAEEIEAALKNGRPLFKRAGGDQYVAVGLADRYLTVYFRYDHSTKEAEVTTAYPSSRKQIKAYRRLTK